MSATEQIYLRLLALIPPDLQVPKATRYEQLVESIKQLVANQTPIPRNPSVH